MANFPQKNNELTNYIWKNHDNDAFFEEIKVEGLKKLALKAGLSTACDVKKLSPYWLKADSILDAGAGYGRAIEFLLKNNFKGSITALERNKAFFQYLKDKYEGRVTLLHEDLDSCKKIQSRFDVIFMLWSALAEFPPSEQGNIISNLATLLNQNGKLIIDTIPANINKPLDTEEFKKNYFLTRAENNIIYTYEASQEDIRVYAKNCALSNIELLECETDTKRIRWIYILS